MALRGGEPSAGSSSLLRENILSAGRLAAAFPHTSGILRAWRFSLIINYYVDNIKRKTKTNALTIPP